MSPIVADDRGSLDVPRVRILAEGLVFPEGPAFDHNGALWLVELKAGRLVHWRSGELNRHEVGGGPNGITIDAQDRVLFTDSAERSLRRFDSSTGEAASLAHEIDGEPLNKPNDLALDPRGNLVFTCPGDSRQEPTGYVAVRRSDGATRKLADNLYFPNGLAFTATGEELIVAETYRQRLWRGRWDADAAHWCEPRIWAEGLVGAPGPDGMAFASDGTLFVAVYGSGSIMHIGHDGSIIGRHMLPGKNPTNCAFDPNGKLGLVVTEAERGLLLSLPNLGLGVPLFD